MVSMNALLISVNESPAGRNFVPHIAEHEGEVSEAVRRKDDLVGN
jgi:hypothetical protein